MRRYWRRLREALRNRIEQRITKAGLAFALAVLLTGTGAFLSGNNLIFLVTSALMATLLVSGFINRLSLSGLRVEFHPPEHLFAREQAIAKLTIHNEKAVTPSFAARLQSIHADGLVQPLFFPMIAGGEMITEHAAVRFHKRGRYRDNSLEFTSRFPFGFAERRARVTLHADVLVYPALEAPFMAHEFLASIQGEIQAHQAGHGVDFYRLRPYTSSDAARRIDWRSSARHGELYVRDNAEEDAISVHILIDLCIGDAGMPWLESALETAAYLCSQLEQWSVPYSVRTQQRILAVPKDGDLFTVLRYLAVVEPIPLALGAGLNAVMPGEDDGHIVVLTPDPARVPAGKGVISWT
jgi:uncharacterized protein (DUF58 family)